MKQRIKSLGIGWTCMLMNWSSYIRYTDVTGPIGWRDHLRWWIEGWLNEAFVFFWDGSDEELRAVEQDEIPLEYMSDRQLRHYFRLVAEQENATPLLTWRAA